MFEPKPCSSAAELAVELRSVPANLDEGEYALLEEHLSFADPYLLLELLSDGYELGPYGYLVADGLIRALSRLQEEGSFPPRFRDSALAKAVAAAVQSAPQLESRMPQYYLSALRSHYTGDVGTSG